MSKDTLSTLLEIIVLLAVVALGVFSGYKWCESEHANRMTALNRQIYDLGVKLQAKTNAGAETNRQLKIANTERIDAIEINDHNSDTIRQLQSNMDVLARKLSKARRDYNYIVLDVLSIKRVFNEARNECTGLPDSTDPSIISNPLSQFTGDSIAGVIKYLVADRCELATDYNSLYATCNELLESRVEH